MPNKRATPTFQTSPSQDYKLQETLKQFEAENTELKGKVSQYTYVHVDYVRTLIFHADRFAGR